MAAKLTQEVMETAGWKKVDHRNGFVEYMKKVKSLPLKGNMRKSRLRKQNVTFYKPICKDEDVAFVAIRYRLKIEGNIKTVEELKTALCLAGLEDLADGLKE